VIGRRLALAVVLALAALTAFAGQASATTVTRVFTSEPITVAGYSVLQDLTVNIPRPQGAGFITHMAADVVDLRTGAQVPINRIMLHHIVFADIGTPAAPLREAFYGDGEERDTMDLPAGYGYPMPADHRWAMIWMLMNHRLQTDTVQIRWTLTWDTDPGLQPVVPMVFDASHGRQGLVYDVAGGGAAGATDVRTDTRPSPVSGRIVAGLGHVHGGAVGLTLSQPTCGDRVVYRARPTWGTAANPFYHVRPILHEPGPINMSEIRTAQGIPVIAGQPLTLTSVYDATRPHTRVMGLMVAYIAPDPTILDGCGAMPTDVQSIRTTTPGRAVAPVFTVPLTGLDASGHAVTIARPPGATFVAASAATVDVGDVFYARRNISIPQGGSVTWRFGGELAHDVTLASGPRGFSSDQLKGGGTWSRRFNVPGRYRIFCSLHPVQMTAVITVRPRR